MVPHVGHKGVRNHGRMSVAVLVPWGGTCPHRRAAWIHVRAWYAQTFPSWRVLRGDCPEEWSKAEAVARAYQQAGNPDVLVVADADCLVPGLSLAVRKVESGAPWAVPHLLVHRLSREATRQVLSGHNPATLSGRHRYAQRPYRGYEGGGVTVLRREVYEQVPLDPRFRGWGQEDESWAHALRTLHGKPWRGSSHLWHLWHPEPGRMNRRTGSEASKRLWQQYRSIRDPERMYAFMEPARDILRGTVGGAL